MTITKHGIWLKDKRGNKASVEYFGSEDAARKALESLEDCDDCINCSGCSRCSYCSDCSGCSRCSYCSGCSDCSSCSRCSDCSRCSYCSDCSGCSGCSYCSGCSHVAYVYDKKDCERDPDATPGHVGAPPIPVVEGLHQKVFEAASQPDALDMGTWHTCETTHCRAGWVTHLAGEAGRALERFHNTELAAMLIYRESSPIRVEPWKFYVTGDEALSDMKRCADEESAAS